MPGTVQLLQHVILVLLIATGVRIVASYLQYVSYTVLLMIVGVGISITGFSFRFDLTSEFILFVLLPTIHFFGAMELKIEQLQKHIIAPIVFVTLGLPVAVLLITVGTHVLTPLPLVFSVLFAVMIYPTDPIGILEVFHEVGVPERVTVFTEGESLFDDGFSVVVFSGVVTLVRGHVARPPLSEIVSPRWLGRFSGNLIVSIVGGLAVGFVVGYVGLKLIASPLVEDQMAEFLSTIGLAFSVFVLADHYVGVSGILATVAVGLLAGTPRMQESLTGHTFEFFETIWDAGEFLVKTFLFLILGSQVRPQDLLEHAWLVAVGTILVLLARALAVYVFLPVVNRLVLSEPIPRRYQHVQAWGTMHTVVPIALVLSLSETLPYHEELRTMVFGVAVTSVLLQGLVIPHVFRATDIVTTGKNVGGRGAEHRESSG